MTIETKFFIGFDDFLEIEVTCSHCKNKAVFAISAVNLSANCPLCGKPWFGGPMDSRRETINGFLWKLNDMQGLAKNFKTDGVSFSIRFQIDAREKIKG